MLAAAADGDATAGTALIELSAPLAGIPAAVLPDGIIRQVVQAYEIEGSGAASQGVVTGWTFMGVPKGGSFRLGVHLARDPGASYAVRVERATSNDVHVDGGTATLTFDSSNWWRMQYVRINAKTTAGTTAQAVSFYQGTTATKLKDLTLYAVDADPAKSGGAGDEPPATTLVASAANLTVAEGGTATFTLRLSAAPAAPVTVATTRLSGDTDISVSGGASLTFSAADWNTPRTVTVAAAADADTVDGSAVLRCSAAGLPAVEVTITEDDAGVIPTLVASTAQVTVDEGGTATFTLRLSAAPAVPVTVATARLSGDTDISVSGGASLTFSAADWSTPQTVTVAAAADADAANGTAVLRCSAAGLASIDVAAVESDTSDLQPPQITVAARGATPVTGTTTDLSVTATDDGGDAGLIYTWSQIAGPGVGTFAAGNGGNAARLLTATVPAAGTYRFRVTVRDASRHSVFSDTNEVVVVAVPTTLTISSSTPPSLAVGGNLVLGAALCDQFGAVCAGATTWAVLTPGGGTIDADGRYTAPAVPMTSIIRASSSGLQDEITVTVMASGTAGDDGDGGSRSCGLGGAVGLVLAGLLAALRFLALGRLHGGRQRTR